MQGRASVLVSSYAFLLSVSLDAACWSSIKKKGNQGKLLAPVSATRESCYVSCISDFFIIPLLVVGSLYVHDFRLPLWCS